MRITTDHAASSYGIPVILNDAGAPMDYADGVREIRRRLGMTAAELGAACGVSGRTVEGWEQGRLPSAPALIAMASIVNGSRSRRSSRS